MDAWRITPEEIEHRHSPEFSAKWQAGDVDTPPAPPFFLCENSGQGDKILIYAIKWKNQEPQGADYSRLMDAATNALEAWIFERV